MTYVFLNVSLFFDKDYLFNAKTFLVDYVNNKYFSSYLVVPTLILNKVVCCPL
jgi:hypothetical protein